LTGRSDQLWPIPRLPDSERERDTGDRDPRALAADNLRTIDQSERETSIFRFASLLLPLSDQMWALEGDDLGGLKPSARRGGDALPELLDAR